MNFDRANPKPVADAEGRLSKRQRDAINTYADADAEIRQASDWLDAFLAPHRASLFAYPYGESNAYLVEDYLPRYGSEHRLRAAFGTAPKPIESTSNRWLLPRHVCGLHWKTSDELERLLTDCN